MEKTKHTPGPWAVTKFGDIVAKETLICTVNQSMLNNTYPELKHNNLEAENNAKLISAAPDLLDEHKSDLILLDVCLNLLGEKKDNSITVISHLKCIVEAKKRAIKKATE